MELTGTASQLEWAVRIRGQVAQEFDRVAAALRSRPEAANTDGLIAILEEKRAEVLSSGSAGYFIKEWQEMDGKVRRMIMEDARYAALWRRRVSGRTS